jgi:AcrR family transcriptional regulator
MPDQPAELGLRERKKLQTRAAIRQAALQLFLAKGYDATTTTQIAAAANVSAGTLFNYFPTKEALLFADDFDPVFIAHLRARPMDEPLFTAFRRAMHAGLAEIPDASTLSYERARLIGSTPSLRSALAQQRQRDADQLTKLLAERYGRPADDFELRVAANVLIAATETAYTAWLDAGGRGDVRAMADHALAVAEAGAAFRL